MTFQFDPERAIDLDVPNPNGVFARFGYIGPYPSRPCDACGCETFYSGDWNLGYLCANPECRAVFGTTEEWAYDKGLFWNGKPGTKAVDSDPKS